MKEIWNVNISIVVFSYSYYFVLFYSEKFIILLIATIILFL